MIRPLARGVIVDEDRVLLAVTQTTGAAFQCPGGEPLLGEAITAAVARHTREQTGYEVDPGEVLWVRETRAADDRPSNGRSKDHVVEFFYGCTPRGALVAAPHVGGSRQVGGEWVVRDRLAELNFLPRSLLGPLETYLRDRSITLPTYAVEDS